MQTEDAKVIPSATGLFVNLPMTKPTGKIRIKRRSFFAQYGEPVAPRQAALSQTCYVEWQIGYDLLSTNENKGKTSLQFQTFRNYKGENKYAYELSEVLFYAYQNGLLGGNAIKDCHDAIQTVADADTFEESVSISRTDPHMRTINGLPFYEMSVSYPLFVHRFGQYEIFTEIMVREKQRAVGTQAMLYVCLPITSLTFQHPAIGRTLEAKECAEWRIGENEAALALELFRVFGMLSPKHRHDVSALLGMLFPDILT